jgi:hypothetical protein
MGKTNAKDEKEIIKSGIRVNESYFATVVKKVVKKIIKKVIKNS